MTGEQNDEFRRRMGEIEREISAQGHTVIRSTLDAAIVAVIRLRAQLTAAVASLDALTHPTDHQHAAHRKNVMVARAVLEETKSL